MRKDIIIESKADLTYILKGVEQEKPVEEYKADANKMLKNILYMFDDVHINDIQVFELDKPKDDAKTYSTEELLLAAKLCTTPAVKGYDPCAECPLRDSYGYDCCDNLVGKLAEKLAEFKGEE